MLQVKVFSAALPVAVFMLMNRLTGFSMTDSIACAQSHAANDGCAHFVHAIFDV